MFEGLDGAASLGLRCLYLVSGSFRGHIGGFSKNYSSGRRNFPLAVEVETGHHSKIPDILCQNPGQKPKSYQNPVLRL